MRRAGAAMGWLWRAPAFLASVLAACSSEEDGPWSAGRPVEQRPEAAEIRLSRNNVERPVLPSPVLDGVTLVPGPGAHAEFELAGQEPRAFAPSVALRVDVAGQQREIAAAPRAGPPGGWTAYTADLSAAPAGTGTLTVLVDGAPAEPERGWVVSQPRLYQERSAAPFNVLIVTVDTLRADVLGCYGHDRDTSSRIDALARDAVLFERAVSQAPWTLPSYASMFTGLYAESHGVVHRQHQFGAQLVSFVELFAAGGYTTGAVVSGTFTDSFWGFGQGFDAYDDLGMVVDDQGPRVANPADPDAMKSAEQRVTSAEVTDGAIAWLERQREHRFLLLAHYFDPHSDLAEHPGISERFPPRPEAPQVMKLTAEPPPPDLARQRALYEGEVAFTDQHVGRLLDAVESLGLKESTIVVVCADHGEEFFERLRVGHGHSLFNEVVHVPLIVYVPGIAPRRVDVPVGNLDLGPTLLELCGLPPLAAASGESLVPLLRGKGERSRPVLSTRIPTVQKGASAEAPDWFRVDAGDWNWLEVLQRRPGQREVQELHFLFRWSGDALQSADLARAQPDEVRRFAARNAELRAALQALAQGPAPTVDLSPELLETLRELGYLDDDPAGVAPDPGVDDPADPDG